MGVRKLKTRQLYLLSSLLLVFGLLAFQVPDSTQDKLTPQVPYLDLAPGYIGPGPCIFEVSFKADTVTIGWDTAWNTPGGPMCPSWDNTNLTRHARIQHSTFIPHCPRLWTITTWADVPGPMVEEDLMDPICNMDQGLKTEEGN